jgi:xanthine dehydrogenase YagS FAD-binding subunit
MRPFTFTRATSIDEAISASGGDRDTRFLAGGTNLIDLMKMGVESPLRLIDVNQIPVAAIEEHNGGLRIGAMARNTDVAAHPLVRERYPVLSEALLSGASPQIRNAATVGGNLMQRTRCFYFYDPSYRECNKRTPGSGCSAIHGYNRIHAILGTSPQCIATHPSDMAVALAALEAVVEVKGPGGERSIPMAGFHRLPGTTPETDTNLAGSEVITAVTLPMLPSPANSCYLKVRDRNSYAFALVSVAAAVEVNGGVVRRARIALGGVAHKPWRVPEAEQAIVGKPASEATYRAAAERLLEGAKAYRDNAFKVELARRSVVRALTTAAARV